jgi:hypothetical protein
LGAYEAAAIAVQAPSEMRNIAHLPKVIAFGWSIVILAFILLS